MKIQTGTMAMEVGSGDKIFGVICHLDTVPAGEANGKHDPF